MRESGYERRTNCKVLHLLSIVIIVSLSIYKKDGHKEHPVDMATSPRRQGVGDPIGGGMHQFPQQQQQLHPAGVHHQQQQQQHHNTQFNSAASAAGGMRHMVVQSDFRKVIDNLVTIFNS